MLDEDDCKDEHQLRTKRSAPVEPSASHRRFYSSLSTPTPRVPLPINKLKISCFQLQSEFGSGLVVWGSGLGDFSAALVISDGRVFAVCWKCLGVDPRLVVLPIWYVREEMMVVS